VRGIASHLSSLSDSQIETYIDDAELELDNWRYDDKHQEKLERYLAAHFATLDKPKKTDMRINGMRKTYPNRAGKEGLKLTEYGKEFLRTIRSSNGPNLMIFS
jgi:hypothetical protein